MLLHRVINKTIFLIIMSFAVTLHAKANDTPDVIKCPSVEAIHQAAPLLNQIMDDECKDWICVFTGLKPAFHENGLSWGLLSPIKASSKDAAILKSQNIAANVSVMFSPIITRSLWPISCLYFVSSSDSLENEITGIMAFPFSGEVAPNSLIHPLLKINNRNLSYENF